MNTNPRDIHFQGFARLLFPEISTRFFTLYAAIVDHKDIQEIDAIEDETKQLIARRAYDLLYFLLDKAPYHSGSFDTGCGTPDEIHETIEHLPDLTSWPPIE